MRTVYDYLYSIREVTDRGLYFAQQVGDCKFVSYSDLYKSALCVGQWLVDSGVKKGQELILSTCDPEDFIYTFWGCVLYGIVPTPIYIDSSKRDNLNLIFNICGHQNILVDSKDTYNWLAGCDFEKPINARLLYNKQIAQSGIYNVQSTVAINRLEEDIVCILFSSGSTSMPKGVGIKNKAFSTEINSFANRLAIDKSDIVLNWMTLNHVYALTVAHLLSTYYAINQYHIPTAIFMKGPVLWLEYINKYRCTISFATNFSLNYTTRLCHVNPNRLSEWDLSCVSIVVSAEPLSTCVLEDFRRQIASCGLMPNALLPGYGITEGTAAVSVAARGAEQNTLQLDKESLQLYCKIKQASFNCVDVISNGFPLEDVQVCIADENGKHLPEDYLGLLCIAGDTVIDTYYNTGQNARAGGWFHTGDIGFLHGGELYVTSRYKFMFFVNSKNYYSGDLESYVIQEGICQVGSVWFVGYRKAQSDVNDSLLCFIHCEATQQSAQIASQIISAIQQCFTLVVEQVVPIADLPKTDSGKIQRYKMLENYQNGQYDAEITKINQLLLAGNTTDDAGENSVLSDVLAAFSQRMGFLLDAQDNYIQIGISSADLTFIYMKLEQKYKRLVSVAELYEFQTPAQLAEYISYNKN